ncbi:MAG: hypothetical protein WCT27_00030 [Patescibacteria group bacterium]
MSVAKVAGYVAAVCAVVVGISALMSVWSTMPAVQALTVQGVEVQEPTYTQVSSCAQVNLSGTPYSRCQDVSACTHLRTANTYYLLTADVSSRMSCMWYEATNSVLDLNGHTITYADVGFDGLANNDFEIAGPSDSLAANWDFSAASHAQRVRDDYIYLSNQYLVSFDDVPSAESIVSDWVSISDTDLAYDGSARTYAGYAIVDLCGSHTVAVESEHNGTVCTSTDKTCSFRPPATDRYRLRVTVNSGNCKVDLADIRPKQDAGIFVTNNYTTAYYYPDYNGYVPLRAPTALIKNGRIVEAGHGAVTGRGVMNLGTTNGAALDHVYIENHGLDSNNYFTIYHSSNILENSTFVNTNTETLDRHALLGPIQLNASSNNIIRYNKMYGGQGGVFLISQVASDQTRDNTGSKVYGNEFRTNGTATNHFAVTVWKGKNIEIYDNTFTQQGSGVFFSSFTQDSSIHDNIFNLTALMCNAEYPTGYATNAIKLTDYNSTQYTTSNNQIYNNTISGTATKDPQFPQCPPNIVGFNTSTGAANLYENNTITLSATNAGATAMPLYDGSLNLGTLRNNRFTSNYTNAWLGNANNQLSQNSLFDSNTFTRGTDVSGVTFHNLHVGFSAGYNQNNHVFLNNTYATGVSIEDVNYPNLVSYSFERYHKWYLYVTVTDQAGRGVTGATVTATSGLETVTGTSGPDGIATLALTEKFIRVADTLHPTQLTVIPYTPHTIQFQKIGYSSGSQTVSADVTKSISVTIISEDGVADTTPPAAISNLKTN